MCYVSFIKKKLFRSLSLLTYDLYSLANIVRVVKSRRMRWVGHVARMGEGRVCTGFWLGILMERDHWGDPDVYGTIILKWIFRKWEGLWGLD
jgi:hypothetical protein